MRRHAPGTRTVVAYPLHSTHPMLERRRDQRSSPAFVAAAVALCASCALDTSTPADDDKADGRCTATCAAAVKFLGGSRELAGLADFSIESYGVTQAHTEAPTPPSPDVGVKTSTFTLSSTYRHASRRFRLGERRDHVFPLAVTRSFTVEVDDTGGLLTGDEGIPILYREGVIDADRRAATVRLHRVLNPHLLLIDVLEGRLTAREGAEGHGEDGAWHELIIEDPAGDIALTVDDSSGRIERARILLHDTLRCDSTLDVSYDAWQGAGRLQFPMVVHMAEHGVPVREEVRTAVRVNGGVPAEASALPSEPREVAEWARIGERSFTFYHHTSAMGVPFPGQQHDANAVPLASGVHVLGPGLRPATHNTLVIEQANGIIVVEAPLNAHRSRTVTDWIARHIPGKPITHVISTHHHVDHNGDVRELVAAGAQVVAAPGNARFLRDQVVAARCSVEPDRLASMPAQHARFVEVGTGGVTLADPSRPVQVFAVPTSHAQDMVLVYLPEQDILFQSDLYNPLPLPIPNLAPYFEASDMIELDDAIDELDLDVDIHVGGHGAVALAPVYAIDLARAKLELWRRQ